jgi:hypothetical protein
MWPQAILSASLGKQGAINDGVKSSGQSALTFCIRDAESTASYGTGTPLHRQPLLAAGIYVRKEAYRSPAGTQGALAETQIEIRLTSLYQNLAPKGRKL